MATSSKPGGKPTGAAKPAGTPAAAPKPPTKPPTKPAVPTQATVKPAGSAKPAGKSGAKPTSKLKSAVKAVKSKLGGKAGVKAPAATPKSAALKAPANGRTGPNVGHKAHGPTANPRRGWLRGQVPCFAAGTAVATPAGSCAIEALTPGSEVFALDPQSGATVVAEVCQTHRGSTSCWLDVELDDGALRTTLHHPVWAVCQQRWVDAVALQPGSRVRLRDGSVRTVTRTTIDPVSPPQPTFNLSVALHETYYAGADEVLVHNGTPLGEPGHSVYVIVDATGRIYYVGRFGPLQTQSDVIIRHSKPRGPKGQVRMVQAGPNKAKNDRLRVVRRGLTYAEARRLEHEFCVRHGTYQGKVGHWRCNRIYPMSPLRFRKYYVKC